ncbi:hypothetical protein GQ53DRAFT_310455 [Thozetella sp. PMI_491]|nr:hypothetical protein GQ53DRAFT_310455 [Thozetella sp. PMI_491]
MAPGSRRSVRLSLPRPMPMIMEDDAVDAPTLPPRSPRRPLTSTGATSFTMYGPPSGAQNEGGASVPDRTPGPEPRQGMWNHAEIARRGGWYRLFLMTFFLVAIIVGLAVGLTIGLRKSDSYDPPPALPTNAFPAGSWSFITALTTVSTACTRNSATFRCYPFATYNPATPNTSAATFQWIIQPVTPYSYVIASSDNPFAPSFTNVSLELVDQNQGTERFSFNFTTAKAVVPSTPLPGSAGAVSCWFNSTLVTATLWTHERATYPANITSLPEPRNASTSFAPWPYRVELKQVQEPGPGVPDCRDGAGQPVGDFHIEPAAAGDESCQCIYANYGLTQSNVTTRALGRKRVG